MVIIMITYVIYGRHAKKVHEMRVERSIFQTLFFFSSFLARGCHILYPRYISFIFLKSDPKWSQNFSLNWQKATSFFEKLCEGLCNKNHMHSATFFASCVNITSFPSCVSLFIRLLSMDILSYISNKSTTALRKHRKTQPSRKDSFYIHFDNITEKFIHRGKIEILISRIRIKFF